MKLCVHIRVSSFIYLYVKDVVYVMDPFHPSGEIFLMAILGVGSSFFFVYFNPL